MIPDYSMDSEDVKKALAVLGIMKLTPQNRRFFLGRFGRAIAALARKNTKEQKTITGVAFPPRKSKAKYRKRYHRDKSSYMQKVPTLILKNIAKSRYLGCYVDSDIARVDYPNIGTSSIAHRQQYGNRQSFSIFYIKDAVPGDQAKKQKMLSSGRYGCSASIAIRLYRIGVKDVKTKRFLSVDEIMGKYSQGQASFIFKHLTSKMSENIKIVNQNPRPFLGVNRYQADKLGAWVMKNLSKSMKLARLDFPDLSDTNLPF